jgi:multimeric flavodoxin WrbA
VNVLVLHGSARKGGDTDTLADRFLAGMAEAGRHEVRHVYPIDMSIAHCRGATCMACGGDGGTAGCVVQDDMQSVYPALREAQVVVLATPMFWGYMTSQLKTLFDRLESVVSPEYFGGKDFVLLIGYRHYYGSMVEWLTRITRAFGAAHRHRLRELDEEDDEEDAGHGERKTKDRPPGRPLAQEDDRVREGEDHRRSADGGKNTGRGERKTDEPEDPSEERAADGGENHEDKAAALGPARDAATQKRRQDEHAEDAGDGENEEEGARREPPLESQLGGNRLREPPQDSRREGEESSPGTRYPPRRRTPLREEPRADHHQTGGDDDPPSQRLAEEEDGGEDAPERRRVGERRRSIRRRAFQGGDVEQPADRGVEDAGEGRHRRRLPPWERQPAADPRVEEREHRNQDPPY